MVANLYTGGQIYTFCSSFFPVRYGRRKNWEPTVFSGDFALKIVRKTGREKFRSEGTNVETVDPMNLEQWEFYVLSENELENLMGSQKSVTLSKLADAGPVDFQGLKAAVLRASPQQTRDAVTE